MRAPLAIKTAHLPHCRERNKEIRYIILHCSAYTPAKQIEILDKLELSTHYIIGANGEITEVVPPEKTAYHAGLSSWQKSTDKSLNDCSIGIELESPSLGQNPADYTRQLLTSLYRLLKELMSKYNISITNILGHSDIAPERKPDPGAAFPWGKLALRGLAAKCHRRMLSKDTPEEEALQMIGYNTNNLPAARYAFCRRFLPEEVETVADIKELLDHPYPPEFIPKNASKYNKTLRNIANVFIETRKKDK